MNISDKIIAHCIFSLGCGGAERNLVTTVRELYKRGYHKQHIVISDFLCSVNLHYEKDLAPLATIHCTDDASGTFRGNPSTLLKILPQRIRRNIIKIQNCLQCIRPDIVHVWSDNAYAALAASLLSVPRILIVWRSMSPAFWHRAGILSWRRLPKTWLDACLFRLALRQASVRLACVCQAGGESYARWLRTPVQRVRTLYHGMDTSRWQRSTRDRIITEKARLGIPPHGKIVLGLMRFDPAKRPELWFDVAHHVRRQYGNDIYFLCFGDGPLRTLLMKRAHEVGVLCPGVTRDVPLALSMADIFLHTARVEGLPTVHLEAQLMGIPIVTTDAGGTRETLIDGVTGCIVPEQPDMVTALSCSLITALHDAGFLERASQEGPRFVKETFSIEKMVQTTLELYQ